MFRDRKEAGELLAAKLEKHIFRKGNGGGKNEIVVVGLPKGGVPVALEVARRFGCKLDLIVTQKIPLPGEPGSSIGAVSSDAVQFMNHDYKDKENWSAYVDEESKRRIQQCRELETDLYKSSGYSPSPLENKVVLIVDDGVASGATGMAAIESARARGARRIYMAVPVIGPSNYQDFCYNCDDVFALHVCEEFSSVAQFYENYPELTSSELVEAMRESAGFSPAPSPETRSLWRELVK